MWREVQQASNPEAAAHIDSAAYAARFSGSSKPDITSRMIVRFKDLGAWVKPYKARPYHFAVIHR
jgi:hypothetical protein